MAFPETPLDLIVELHISGAWVDITDDVRGADGIDIQRGRANEQGRISASTCALTINNRDGKYSPRNPTGPYYGLIGRNTPLRVRVGADVRFSGEVSAWPQRWDSTGADVWTPVQASGILRRLDRSTTPLLPPLRRALDAATPIAWWPLDDGRDATTAASALPSGRPMLASGAPTFGGGGGPGGDPAAGVTICSGAVYLGALDAAVPTSATGSWTVEVWVSATLVAGATAAETSIIAWETTGTYSLWEVRLSLPLGSAGDAAFFVDRQQGPDVGTWRHDGALTGDLLTGAWHHVRVDAIQSGADTTMRIWVDGVLTDTRDDTTATVGHLVRVSSPTLIPGYTSGGIDTVRVAHLAVYDQLTSDHSSAGSGYVGETAADRLTRLCAEANVPFTLIGTAADTMPMGTQESAKILDLLEECAEADLGILHEPRTSLGLAYRTRTSLVNQTPTLALDYSSGHLSEVPDPVDDDAETRNDVTVRRDGGSSARAVLETGALSIQAPPDGVGSYPASLTPNVATDDVLTHLAHWQLGQGTLDRARYPRLAVDLARQVFAADAALSAAAADVDLGDLVTLDGLPAWLPPDQVLLLAQGVTERLGTYGWRIAWNTTPGDQYQVFQVDDATLGRVDTGGSRLLTPAAAGASPLLVETTSGPRWTTAAGDLPLGLGVGGEQMTATGVSDITCTFVAAGVASHADNAAITPGMPAGWQAGDLLLCWCAYRNLTTPQPYLAAPAGWTLLVDATNCRLYGRIAQVGDTAPTLTVSGTGVAGASCSAQLAAFRGATMTVLDTAQALHTATQDITSQPLPVTRDRALVVQLGWKSDDWTSVTAPAGSTLIGAPSTVTGSDHGICWASAVQTTATHVPSGTFTVTGGVAAVWRAASVSLRTDTQSITVTRGVNGVAKAHQAGADVSLWTTGVVAL